MANESRGTAATPSVLATDLDGTLIPLEDHEANRAALAQIADSVVAHEITLTFVTGRHADSVRQAIADHALPPPQWIIGDVGTTMYEYQPDRTLTEVSAYAAHLESICSARSLSGLRHELADIPALQLQEAEKQGRFKLSYYVARSALRETVPQLEDRLVRSDTRCSLISSIDPFTGDGLIDLVPRGVSKAYALQWWGEKRNLAMTEIVFAGDSGNDLAALVAGHRTILVGNADRELAAQVTDAHRRREWTDRLFLAREPATSGVLSGCRWFGLFPPVPESHRAAPSRDR